MRATGCDDGRRVAITFPPGALLLILFLASQVEDVSSVHASAHCVQLGQANANTMDYDTYTDTRRMGPWTIGTRKFDVIYNFLDFAADYKETLDESVQDCPYVEIPNNNNAVHLVSNPCPTDNEVQVRAYAVKQNGRVMNGWLHFEFELMDPDDKILAIYVQIRDEFYNAIGEFVSNADEQCDPDPILAQPTEYQILPCSAVGFREAKISNAIFMADKPAFRNQSAIEDKFLSNNSIARGIHFTWRLSEYWCNRHLRFRPEAIIITEKIFKINFKRKSPKVYRKAASYWLHPRWFGAADIKLPATKLECDDQIIDYAGSGTLEKVNGKLVAPWLEEKAEKSRLANDYVSSSQYYFDAGSGFNTLKSCQVNTRLMRPVRNDPTDTSGTKPFQVNRLLSFAGRCTHHYEKTPSHDALQGCNLNANAPEFRDILQQFPNLTTYSDYVNVLFINRTNLCSVDCRPPNSTQDLMDILKFNDTSGEGNFTEIISYNSDNRRRAMIEKFWVGRKYHAVLCIIWSMFLTPLGIFCARYFKETCMRTSCTGAHFWFWLHVGTSVLASAAFFSSLSGIWQNLETWGRSVHEYGVAHRVLGYMSVVVFMLMMVLGGFRPLDSKKRIVVMIIHSVMGFLIYFSNMLALIFAGFIPASPSMGDCDEEGNSSQLSRVFYVILIWILIDFSLHIVMTALQMMKDKQVGVKRPWYCPIVPILPFDSAQDFVGSSLRKITLLVYAASSFILTNAAIGLILNSSLSEECKNKTGLTTCDNPWGCSAAAKAYLQMANLKTKNETGVY